MSDPWMIILTTVTIAMSEPVVMGDITVFEPKPVCQSYYIIKERLPWQRIRYKVCADEENSKIKEALK